MNLNSQIDWNDTDRIVSNDTRYVSLNGDWWRESSYWQTRQNDSSALTRVGLTRTRLTGLGDGLVSETRSIDPLGNETVSCTTLDRATHTTTRTTTTPASTLPAETVARCGLTVSSRSPTGVTTTYAYDALGRQISQTDGRGNTSQIVYDAQGRVAKTIDALGHETTYAYDALGRQTAVTDPLGHTVTTTYDAEGRVTSQRGATYPVDYTYDAYGNKVAMTTYRNESLTAGDTTRWLYDEPSGCMTNKLYADGKGPRYDYTPDGKLARRTWARGIVTEYTYDNAGNLTRTEYNDNGATPTITMSYDRVGNLVNATTAGVVTDLYAYDLYGQCTNEWQNDFNLTRYYDALGRSTGYAINGTRQTTIAYDTYGRISTMCMAEGRSGVLTASNENEFAWSYLPNTDLKASLQYPNGLTASWAYDANNQLLQVRNATPTKVISQFDYTYDAAGRRVSIAKSGSAFGDLSGSIDAYTYNARSELTSARRTKNGQPIPGFSEDFDYDPIGNRRSSATYNEKGEAQTSTYEANNLNQYTSRTTPGYAAVRGEADPNAMVTVNENPTFRLGSYYFGSDLFDNSTAGGLATLQTYATLVQTAASDEETEDLVSATTNQVYIAQSPETFAYDDDGNQTLITTKTGQWRVTYNGENRPIRWVRDSDNTTLAMRYDHMGRRREKNNQRFFYDGYLQIADNIGNTYAWDCTETVVTRPLVWLRADFAVYYSHDGNMNVSEITRNEDSIAAHYEYSPFGVMILSCGALDCLNSWRFSSEYAENETGLMDYGFRQYNALTAKWMSRDPYWLSNDYSRYMFCHNYPIGVVDVLGLWWTPQHVTMLHDALSSIRGELDCLTNPDVYEVILRQLVEGNRHMDTKDPYKKSDETNLPLHYNRIVEQDIKKAKDIYRDGLKVRRELFNKDIEGNPTVAQCDDALEQLGQLTHMIQDYYGHGVGQTYSFEGLQLSKSSGVLSYIPVWSGDVGKYRGSPWELLMKPSSYTSPFLGSEHGSVFSLEPGVRAPDYSSRKDKAVEYTAQELRSSMQDWCKKCCKKVKLIERAIAEARGNYFHPNIHL